MRGSGAASEAMIADAGGEGGQGKGEGLPREQPLESYGQGIQTLERRHQGFCLRE